MLVSIVTPAFNSVRFLEDNINSVNLQQYEHEHIVVDGGSSDGSLELLNSYGNTLTHWISEPDTGQSNAINKGLSIARGKFLNWVNSDDFLMPSALEIVADIFDKNPDVDIVCGRSLLVSVDKKPIKTIFPKLDKSFLYAYAGMVFPQPSAFFRSSALRRVGYLNEELVYGMDYEFFLRILLHGGKIYRSNNCLSAYRLHPNSKTMTSSLGFAEDWIRTFNNFLYEEKHSVQFIDILKSLNLYRSQTLSYYRTRYLDLHQLRKVFIKALHHQFAFRAVGGDMQTARSIAKYLFLHSKPSRNTSAYIKKIILRPSSS
jgi:glycosyltransferase involved in cell wall biosynthesis